jgi:hypothetical protein
MLEQGHFLLIQLCITVLAGSSFEADFEQNQLFDSIAVGFDFEYVP